MGVNRKDIENLKIKKLNLYEKSIPKIVSMGVHRKIKKL